MNDASDSCLFLVRRAARFAGSRSTSGTRYRRRRRACARRCRRAAAARCRTRRDAPPSAAPPRVVPRPDAPPAAVAATRLVPRPAAHHVACWTGRACAVRPVWAAPPRRTVRCEYQERHLSAAVAAIRCAVLVHLHVHVHVVKLFLELCTCILNKCVEYVTCFNHYVLLKLSAFVVSSQNVDERVFK